MRALAKSLFDEAFTAEIVEGSEAQPTNEWSAAGKGKIKSRPQGEDYGWWAETGPKMVDDWMTFRRNSGWRIWQAPTGEPGIELSIVVDIPGVNQQLKMFIDRVFVLPTGELCIVDLKTGSRTPDSDLQLAVYRYGIYRQFSVDANLGGYWMARKAAIPEIVPLAKYKPALIERWFADFVKAKEQKIFVPHPTTMCRACALRDYCAANGGSKAHLVPDPGETT